MLEKLNPNVKKVLENKTNLINTFSTESKLKILAIAETGDAKALKQTIEYTNLGGDY